MLDWFYTGGFFMWPVLLSGLIAVGLAVDAVRTIIGTERGERGRWRAHSRTDGVLFWGGFAALVGMLGTLGGIAQMARVLQGAGETPASLVWGGVGVTLTTTIFGLAVLLLALAMWFGLTTALRESPRG